MSTRRHFLAAAAAAAASPALGQTPSAARRPNILLLFPDQWRRDWMASNTELDIRTPNLDRLAAEGVTFEQAIVPSPVCSPSRACLASGREYDRQPTAGNNLNYVLSVPTFYERLRTSGYHTLATGKLDLAKAALYWGRDGRSRTRRWGFEDAINSAGKWDLIQGLQINDNQPTDPYGAFLQSRGLLQRHRDDYDRRWPDRHGATFPTPLPADAYGDNWVTDATLRLLGAAPAGKPWFMQVNWPGPHSPWDITVEMEKGLRDRKVPDVVGVNEYDAAKNRAIRQNYTAMCENIDRQIGRLLDHLRARSQLENTLVIFSSDHGEMLGDQGRWSKSVPFEASIGVPMIIAGAGVTRRGRSKALVSLIDITATALDYGAAPDPSLDGRSLRPLLQEQTDRHRRVVYSGLGGWRMAYDGRYKVITGFAEQTPGDSGDGLSRHDPRAESQPVRVYDLQADPQELRPLTGSMPDAATRLLRDLESGTYPV